MRTLHLGLHVADLQRSLDFYCAVGYEIVGQVPETPLGHLAMLKLPGDELVTIELVYAPGGSAAGPGGAGLSHFVIKVDSMDDTLASLATHGINAEEPISPDGSADFQTTRITDPDGTTIELVQWPTGHAEGLTAADWST